MKIYSKFFSKNAQSPGKLEIELFFVQNFLCQEIETGKKVLLFREFKVLVLVRVFRRVSTGSGSLEVPDLNEGKRGV